MYVHFNNFLTTWSFNSDVCALLTIFWYSTLILYFNWCWFMVTGAFDYFVRLATLKNYQLSDTAFPHPYIWIRKILIMVKNHFTRSLNTPSTGNIIVLVVIQRHQTSSILPWLKRSESTVRSCGFEWGWRSSLNCWALGDLYFARAFVLYIIYVLWCIMFSFYLFLYVAGGKCIGGFIVLTVGKSLPIS